MQTFSNSTTNRALQVWSILIGCAHRRQTIRYHDLSRLMYGHEVSGLVPRHALRRIAAFCQTNELPMLNMLVVNTEGLPGRTFNGGSLDAEREAIFAYDWYNIVPPTIEELPLG